MAPLQVIGAGYGRTATDSLRLALNTLGYNTHHMKCMFQDPEQDPNDFFYAVQNNGQADWDRIYAKYTAAVDWPSCTFYKQLMVKYPDAKVILTVRSADSWYESVKNTIHQRHVHAQHEGKTMEKFHRMARAVIMDGVVCDPERFNKEKEVKRLYLDHIEQVKNHVPKDRLYVMEMGEGWDGLCNFLGKEVPGIPYPRVNSTKDFQNNVATMQRSFFKQNEIK